MDAQELYDYILADSVDTKQQGTRWEHAVKRFLENDAAWAGRLDKVWMWEDAPTKPEGQKVDLGIDLVARDAEDSSYWAIQAKCYSKSKLAEKDVSTFLGYAGLHDTYQHLIIADTTREGWTANLTKTVRGGGRL